MYADFESVLVKQAGCENTTDHSWTQKSQNHVPCGSCLYDVSSDKRFYQSPIVNQGPDSGEKFLDQVQATAVKIRQYLKNKIRMDKLTSKQWEELHKPDAICHICVKTFKGISSF